MGGARAERGRARGERGRPAEATASEASGKRQATRATMSESKLDSESKIRGER
jgi:hypothetical protein